MSTNYFMSESDNNRESRSGIDSDSTCESDFSLDEVVTIKVEIDPYDLHQVESNTSYHDHDSSPLKGQGPNSHYSDLTIPDVLSTEMEMLRNLVCTTCGRLFDSSYELYQHKLECQVKTKVPGVVDPIKCSSRPTRSCAAKIKMCEDSQLKKQSPRDHVKVQKKSMKRSHDKDVSSKGKKPRGKLKVEEEEDDEISLLENTPKEKFFVSSYAAEPKQWQKGKVIAHYECPKCLKRFVGFSKLKRHLRAHRNEESKKFTCNVCGSAFTLNYNLTAHMKRYHTQGDAPQKCQTQYNDFICNECNLGFKVKSRLEHHMTRLHSC
ncbi:putative zinc finger protein 840 [Neocloeon triangulifer]|uniref:putative zinc finger protein 840 n=1 Tax=Neocloeon triangulifer TaxID=2078957 RepID=UPI00286F84D6|nr:putative zinc finger protein 840 [Neocloeon triangulifer]